MLIVCPMTPRAVVEAQFVTALVGDSTLNEESVHSAEGPSQLGNCDTSVTHNSLLLTVKVRRKAYLTNPTDSRRRSPVVRIQKVVEIKVVENISSLHTAEV
jgi:hypothetical protein